MSRYRNKLVYNADTGEIRDDKKFMSMLEDFWASQEGKAEEALRSLRSQVDKILEEL